MSTGTTVVIDGFPVLSRALEVMRAIGLALVNPTKSIEDELRDMRMERSRVFAQGGCTQAMDQSIRNTERVLAGWCY